MVKLSYDILFLVFRTMKQNVARNYYLWSLIFQVSWSYCSIEIPHRWVHLYSPWKMQISIFFNSRRIEFLSRLLRHKCYFTSVGHLFISAPDFTLSCSKRWPEGLVRKIPWCILLCRRSRHNYLQWLCPSS